MASMLSVFIAVLAGYLAAGTLIAAASRRYLRGGLRDYYVSGRLGSFLSAMTYAATTYSSFMIVGLVGFTYATGAGALGFEIAYFTATLGILVLLAERTWRMSRERGWVSPAEMIADLSGARWVAPLISIIYMVSLVFYAGAQLKAVGEAVAAPGGEHYYLVGVLLGLLIMLVWSGIAGIWSVAATDAFQGLWMLASGLGLLAWVWRQLHVAGYGLADAGRVLVESGHLVPSGHGGYWGLNTFLAFSLPWIFFAVTNPQALQRLYVPRDEQSLRGMIKWFSIFGISYTIIVTLTGLLAYAGNALGIIPLGVEASVKYADKITPRLLLLSGPVLGSIVFTSIVAAAVSTADSILLTLASSASSDLVPRGASEKQKRLAGVIAMLAIGAAMAAIAAARVAFIVKLSVLSSFMLLGLAPPVIALLAGLRVRPWAVAAASLTGPVMVAAGLAYYSRTASAFKAVLLTFASRPLGVSLAAWILLVSLLVTLAGLRRPVEEG